MSTAEENKKAVLATDKFSKPSLPSLQELRDAIPKRCFEKNLHTSLAFTVLDFCLLALFYKIEPLFELAGVPGLLLWYFFAGLFLTLIFIIGHDCGHGLFSNHTWINDIVGHICHGMVFAPYWPWQRSHRLHHSYTGHVTKDHGHAWNTEKMFESWSDFRKFLGTNSVPAILVAHVGWFFYTFFGQDGSHFWPWSKLFKTTEERVKCVVSGLVCVAWAYAAFCYFGSFGAWVKFYVLPCLSHSFWLLMITYLQHQTDDIQVYEDGTWGYLKGALQTIDRPWGYGLDTIMHHITNGHVAHHLFFTGIPHYHLMEATEVVKAKLEPHGVYRHIESNDFLYQYGTLPTHLHYLIGEGTGMLQYAKLKKID